MLRPSLQSLFAACVFFSVAFANALPNNGVPVKYETVVVYETITTCITTSSVYTISAPTTTCSLSSGSAIIPPPPPKSTITPSQEYTTSTVYVTTVKTITSCAKTVTSCPATEATHTYVVTDTISSYTTICPVTATQTPTGPNSPSYPVSPSSSSTPSGPSSPSYPVSPSSSPSASVSKSYSETKSYGSTSSSSSASASPTYPVSTSTVSSGSSVSTYKPTSSSTVSPSSSSSVTTSASYTVVSSSSTVSSSYSASSPSTSSSKYTVQSTSSTVSSSSSSPAYSASKSTSSTTSSSYSSPTYSASKSTSSSSSSTTSSSYSSPTYSASKSTSSSSSSTTSSSYSASKSTSMTSSSTSTTSSSSSTSKSSTTSSSTLSSTTSSSTSKTSTTSSATPTPTACSYWMENIKHQGIAPFAGSGYQVFRNVKDKAYGAKGDGVTDDTAAIQLAISTGSNCPPTGACQSSSTTPALIYFPPGTYIISSPILMHYGSSFVGNPNCPPVLKAKSTFPINSNPAFSTYIVDGNAYGANGLAYGATNTFWRQFRNFVLDTTAVRSDANILGLHWPTAQATSVENVVFKASDASGTQQGGMLSEQGSGGFMGNLTFYGGLYGLDAANQQFTMRNLNFHNAVTAIKQDFNWGWVYKGISITNCSVGIQFGRVTDPTNTAEFGHVTVSSLTLVDSSIVNTPVGISLQVSNELATRPSEESLIIENLSLTNVPTAVGAVGGATLLAGTTGKINIAGWGRGPSYTAAGHTRIQGNITPATRPDVLKASTGEFYQRSKPQYETYQNTSFVSVRSSGAKGDGVTDDTAAITSAITSALSSGSILFFDAGYYVVSSTIYIPPGSKITGEGYPVILASGPAFTDMNNPTAVVKVGKSGGEKGTVEWSNMIVSTKGAAAGAILIEWNLDATGLAPAGMWDVHTRVGGFTGSNLQLAQCPTGSFDSRNGNVTMTSANLPQQCIAAFMSMHVTKAATGLYMENVWLWVADHDVDDAKVTQITIFAGRGLLVESTAGAIWMYGTAVEHHALYQYQLANTANIYMGEIQTETPYYQPNPNTAIPFPAVASLNDPATASDALGLRILSSNNILVYGAGLYSFFSNYNVHCSDAGNGEWCQPRILSVEKSSAITVYGLNTVGTQAMISVDGKDVASSADNVGATKFIDSIAKFTQ